jgi:uracil-DNA glycosylase
MKTTKGFEALQELAELYSGCTLCPGLTESRSQVVFGAGSSTAPIMIISKAPDSEEDAEGIPFWGEAGRLLMDLLAHAWPETEEMLAIRDLDEDGDYFEELREYLDQYIFWTNTVLCRPPALPTHARDRERTREPSAVEKNACRSRLDRTIYAVDPLLIIGVGKTAASSLMGSTVQITQKRGRIFDISIPSPVTGEPVRYPMLVLVDPGFLLQRGDQDLLGRKKGHCYQALEDLKWALSLLQSHHETVRRTDFPSPPEDDE